MLCEVLRLVRETDFERYVVMGDHGEALGEYGQYYHSIEHPKVGVVPWATIDDVVDDVPEMWEYTATATAKTESTEQRLRELGYLG